MMLSQHTSILARILGVAIVGAGACFVSYLVVATIVNAPQTPWWELGVAFAFYALFAWGLTSFGESFWENEGGWYGLQRFFRLIQAAVVGGGFACTLFFKVFHFQAF